MFKYILTITFTMLFSLSNIYAEPKEISAANVEALKVIAGRKGLWRLDYNKGTKKWSYFNTGVITSVRRALFSKSRHDIISPLENLVKDMDDGYWISVSKNPELFHVIRRSYSSLSSLYSFYKINPDTDAARQADFIGRFSSILAKLKVILDDIERKIQPKDIYKAMPWFGEVGMDVEENDKSLGLHYLDMGRHGLTELNSALKKIGNDSTSIDRAMEFYPSSDRNTSFKSAFSDSAAKKPVIILVHGTFVDKFFVSKQKTLLQQAKYTAQSLANDQNVPVEVYSFGWNGSNDNESRIDAGVELANFINTYFPKEEYADIYIGHSHGGNVITHFAKTVRYSRTPYMIITLATPIRKDFITDNVNYLFQFYTEGDLVQYAGSYEMTSRNTTATGDHTQSHRLFLREDIAKLGYFASNDHYEKVKIYATKVLHNMHNPKGCIKSHSDLKHMVGALPRVVDTLLQHRANNKFVLNIDLDEKANLSATEMDRLRFQLLPTSIAK